jgi:hypothetical protein
MRPADCHIAVLSRLEVFLTGRPIVRLSGVVVAFAVAAHVEDFVFGIWGHGGIGGCDLVGEALPLGFVGGGSAVAVGGVGAVDEAEIGSSKVEHGCVGFRVALEEVTGHCRVIYVGVHRGEAAEGESPARKFKKHGVDDERMGSTREEHEKVDRREALTYLICT